MAAPHWLGGYCPPGDIASRLANGQWCAFGVPVSFDYSDATRGAMGPELIRKSLPFLWDGFPRLLWDWSVGGAVETASNLPLDVGDIPYDRRLDRACDVEDRITDLVSDIARNGGRPLALGGEHWITYPVLRGLAQQESPLSVVHFDAHSDTHSLTVPRGRPPVLRNNNVMTFVASLPGVEKIIQIGLREYDPAVTLENLRPPAKCEVLSADDIPAHPGDDWAVFSALPAGSRVYVTIDADVLDPAFAPEVGWPVPGGISLIQLTRLLRSLRSSCEIVGFDLVEVMGTEQGVNRAALAMARCAMVLVADRIELSS